MRPSCSIRGILTFESLSLSSLLLLLLKLLLWLLCNSLFHFLTTAACMLRLNLLFKLSTIDPSSDGQIRILFNSNTKKIKNNKYTDISQISNSCFVIQEPPFFIVSKASINTWQLSIYGCPCVNRASPSPVGVAYSLTFQSSLILLFANNAGLIRFMFIWI